MCRLIHAEIYKLFRMRSFKILCIIALILGISMAGLSKLSSSEDFIKSSLKSFPPEQQQSYIEQIKKANAESYSKITIGSMGFFVHSKDMFHPTGKDIFRASFGIGVIEILLSVLIGSMIAKEYSSGTIKNILAYGKKREYYYIAKTIAAFVGFTIILGLMVASTTIISNFTFGWGAPFAIKDALYILKIFAAALAIGLGTISCLIFISTLVKSNGATILIGIILFSISPMFIAFLYGKYTWFDKLYKCILPYNWALATSAAVTNNELLRTTSIGIITLLITAAAGIAVFKNQDIK